MRISDWSSDVCSSDLAFVTATAAIRHFWKTDDFANDVKRRAELLGRRLKAIAATDPDRMSVKGRGMMQGIDVGSGELASVITSAEIGRASCRERVCQYV